MCGVLLLFFLLTTEAPDPIAIKRTEKPVTGFSCFRSGIVHCNPWKASVAPFTPIPCQSRERSELIFTGTTAIQVLDGRRRKKCSAICPSLRGCYLGILGFKGMFWRGANSVCDILLSYRATDSGGQLSTRLGFILFYLFYSLFILVILINWFYWEKKRKGVLKIGVGVLKIGFYSRKVY